MSSRILWDADAFICAYSLGLLRQIASAPAEKLGFVMTEYVARRELCDLAAEIGRLKAAGWLFVERMSSARSSPEGKRYHELQQGKLRVHKGEAEALAWTKERAAAPLPVFISNDRRARQAAARLKLPYGDLLDFVIIALDAGVLAKDDAERHLAPWNTKVQAQCRPRDYVGDLHIAIERRRVRPTFYPPDRELD